jgi:dienelactone hydrolase
LIVATARPIEPRISEGNVPHSFFRRCHGSELEADDNGGCWRLSQWSRSSVLTLFGRAGTAGEIELYPGVHHGFAFPQRWCYDKPAADRHWERLIALYRRRLG